MTVASKIRGPAASKPSMTRLAVALGSALGAVVGLLASAAVARADSFGGVAGNEKVYLIGRDKVCAPIVVSGGKASGTPACRTAPTAEIAGLSIKSPAPERGSKAEVTVAARGSQLTVSSKDGAALVTWSSFDPIVAVVDVWRSSYGRLVMVEYTVRRGGRELHDVVGFDLGVGGGGKPVVDPPGPPGPVVDPIGPIPPTTDVAPPPTDPAIDKAAAKARKAKGKAAIAAWAKVLTLDPEHAEARYRIAVAQAQLKQPAPALDLLEALARSSRTDAAEWLVEARGDKAFRALVADARFRAAVGLDRKAGSIYERIMGLGGVWEQALVPCEKPEIVITFGRDRVVRMVLRTACEGMREKGTYKGTWATTKTSIELRLPKPGGGNDTAPCTLVADGDEDRLTCALDEDLEFDARPVRR